jgi:hypothetical protein
LNRLSRLPHLAEAMENQESQRSILYLQPYEGESISHYLGRWRRQETVSLFSIYSLSHTLRLGKVLTRWEKFFFNPYPTQAELEKVRKVLELEVDRLLLMFPPKNEPLVKPGVVRFCPTCYIEAPYHRIEWQFQSTAGCEKHRLRLFAKCPGYKCEERIPLPALWGSGRCEKCGMPYKTMARKQKPY